MTKMIPIQKSKRKTKLKQEDIPKKQKLNKTKSKFKYLDTRIFDQVVTLDIFCTLNSLLP